MQSILRIEHCIDRSHDKADIQPAESVAESYVLMECARALRIQIHDQQKELNFIGKRSELGCMPPAQDAKHLKRELCLAVSETWSAW
jgi:hypothetical protein